MDSLVVVKKIRHGFGIGMFYGYVFSFRETLQFNSS